MTHQTYSILARRDRLSPHTAVFSESGGVEKNPVSQKPGFFKKPGFYLPHLPANRYKHGILLA
ncbi:hypothetical protein [Argonema antarcticum]|uniref:hypothetical protein n=1 Tax=Argonema antarcticum TaxID=2942763 RepID=UPI0020126B64|nr:hypothetical protein [Argonema antarcticum]MCL1475796.1 hypothetical protein [Argonema antarcticum A004/B2]